jgi:hypothetical protein
MALMVYLLGAATSFIVVVMLARGYKRTGARLLFWSAICFAGFFLNNVLLVVDKNLLPEQDLSVMRSLPLLGGTVALLYGLIWDSRA